MILYNLNSFLAFTYSQGIFRNAHTLIVKLNLLQCSLALTTPLHQACLRWALIVLNRY